MKTIVKMAITSILVLLMTACDGGLTSALLLMPDDDENPIYYTTIEREGNLTIVDKERVKECIANYDNHYGTKSHDLSRYDNIEPSVAIFIKYGGKLKEENYISLDIHPLHNKTKKLSAVSYYPCNEKYHIVYLITDDMLNLLDISDSTNHVTDGVYIESIGNDKNLPKDQYIIKITKNELNRALDLKYSKYEQQ